MREVNPRRVDRRTPLFVSERRFHVIVDKATKTFLKPVGLLPELRPPHQPNAGHQTVIEAPVTSERTGSLLEPEPQSPT